ncbi:cytochrome c biogenesis protein CcsA [Ichthyenterobacterium sp. W332]|uniref:Cytochrome c biogenesis protein CcsA n=1 Tax=Microcosmobacter mediterraneus TaxID=3075607 RepID=A0ABU2YKR8_9FLAO|nr:cytochrome c biogenesis protein CcsA [Ichthyenterobacterium sp. W332]MDT0557623.1 cytochrome c biogenesis protein CcsA [Ichthyenterobacterium sp. W332]
MLEKLSKILFSTRLTASLFIIFAAAMAIGTFMDAGQDTSPTPYTRNLIYNTWWFEGIMVVFVINFIGNIFRFRLYKKAKWATLTLHLSFIFILLGAFVTRYIGYEGMMAIREGASENKFLSTDTYVTVYVDGDYRIDGVPQRLSLTEKVDFSPRLDNDFEINVNYNKQPVSIKLKNFISGAEEDIIPDASGEQYLKVVESAGNQGHNHFLKLGEVQSLHNTLVSLNKPTPGAINIFYDNGKLSMQSPFEGEYFQMATGNTGAVVKDSIQPLMLRSRYLIGNMQMVFPDPVTKGVFGVVKKPVILKGDEDGVILEVTTNGETKEVGLLGGKGSNNPFEQIKIGGLDIALKYGSKVLELPFNIKLNDFIAEKYPGTEKSYASYESKVTVLDTEQGDFDYHIYMNNILDHKGYRFFQASFDPDEKGTILSVNHDQWGTWLTYLGYFLLYFGLMAILFDKHTRFGDLKRLLEKVKTKKAKLLAGIALLCSIHVSAQDTQHSPDDGHDHSAPTTQQLDSILRANIAPKDHADNFGRVVVQDLSGRMMPMNTFASEFLRKLSKKDSYLEFDANQILLSIYESKSLWYNMDVIYLKPRKGDSIRKLIGVPKDQKYVSLIDFFDRDLNYKLDPYLEAAYKAQVPNGFQKEFKETDQRVNLLNNVLEGSALKIFPVPDDENNTWISPTNFRKEGYREQIKDSLYANFINSGFSAYLFTLNKAKQTGDFADANKLLESFKKTQEKYGSAVMLSEEKVNSEVLYNKYDIFKKLFSWYMYAGTLLFVLLIVQIFKDRIKSIDIGVKVLIGIIIALFVLHTASLIWRWYISGHAPWSDAYESMIYVAWATMFFGLAFGRKSNLTIASTTFVVSMILMIAHWNWMDPAIANLQPVLNSYWLMIHVAVIVGSYGPFALGMILGLVALLLMIFTTSENKAKMDLNIKELTIINEMALTVGLVMLTIGNFLGGMWANESWGRYWGWDPKETWALISIMIYAFVIHMRLVPGLRGRWFYNLMSVLAFASIMMTYFGVNFYLAGLHSYASGDQIISLKFIGAALAIILIIAFFAHKKYLLHYKK